MQIVAVATGSYDLTPLFPYINLGLAGIFLGLFVTGKIRPGSDLKDQKDESTARYDKLDAKYTKLEEYNKDELIPLVVSMSGALTENTKLLVALKAERDAYIERLQKQERQRQGD